MSEKQVEANRENSLQSTGPRTPEGVEDCKLNAFRHGLRAVQTVVPGEDAAEWETHRAAHRGRPGPGRSHGDRPGRTGGREALATRPGGPFRSGSHRQCPSRGRAAPGSRDDPCSVSHAAGRSEPTSRRGRMWRSARHAAETAAKKLTERTEALGQLQGLAAMEDDEVLPRLALYEVLREDFRPDKNAVEGLFKGEVMSLFRARHARKLILICFKDKGELDELQVSLAADLGQSTGATQEGRPQPPGRARELGPPLRGGPGTAATRQRSPRREGPGENPAV